MISQSRRDFKAVFECESCEAEETISGYDDTHFHQKVIPDMKCKNCEEKAPAQYRALAPKYAEHQQV